MTLFMFMRDNQASLNHQRLTSQPQQPQQDQSADEQRLDQSPEIADERFFSSKKSQLGKARLWLWSGAALGIAISVLANKGGSKSFVFVLIVTLIIIGSFDWLFRRRLNIGKASVILDREAIESPVFFREAQALPVDGDHQRYACLRPGWKTLTL